jgi:hypothetical protein
MRVDDAITYVIKNAPNGLTPEEVYQAVYKLAENDPELLEDWLAQDQDILRQDAKKEAASRKRYIAKESKRKRS